MLISEILEAVYIINNGICGFKMSSLYARVLNRTHSHLQ